jgi:hypothetical protein
MWAGLDSAVRKNIPAKAMKLLLTHAVCKVKKHKAVPVTGYGGP